VYTQPMTIVAHTKMTTLRNCTVALYTSDVSMWFMSFFMCYSFSYTISNAMSMVDATMYSSIVMSIRYPVI